MARKDPFGGSPYRGGSTEIVVVPDLAAVDLAACLEKEHELTSFHPAFREWDFYTANDGSVILGRGRRFEVLIWTPELTPTEYISSNQVREHLRGLGFFGHTGAFIQWRRIQILRNSCATIPDDNHCKRDFRGLLSAPTACFYSCYRELNHASIRYDWYGGWSFVGFRLV